MAHQYAVMPTTAETVLSQLGHHIFGGGIAYYALQYSTFAILVLAANTAFADFPRLAGILANDKFMPSQLPAAATGSRSRTASSASRSSRCCSSGSSRGTRTA